MFCCRPGRRDLLRLSVILSGFSLMPVIGETRARASDVRPVNLELVTLTETSAVFTWYTGVSGTDDGLGRMRPAAADGEILIGTRPGRLTRVVGETARTPYHYVEVTGLEPGRTYYYQARSGGRSASQTSVAGAAGTPLGGDTFSFTTPQPPPGRFLFSIALCNDLHLGETVAGLVGGLPFKGISQAPGRPPYPKIMAEAMVRDARKRGATYLLAAGDVSSEAVPGDLDEAKRILDGFGTYRRDYLVARGNHDRAHDGDAYAACRVGEWQGHDCFRDVFSDGPTYFSHELSGLRVIGLDTYDKAGNGGDAGGLSEEQFAWFEAALKAHKDQPTLVFGHHPLLSLDDPLAAAGGTSLNVGQTVAVMAAYERTPGVFLHHAGHTHRNKRTVLPGSRHVTQQEVGATKEYPGGFNLLRVHSGGYALNFYKTRDDLAREWSERSRQEIDGLWPQFSFGPSAADRNSVTARDLSGLRPAR
ncbi:purple acid phosphatase family protein [Actinoallomurus soli]|uniref:purple acid phosphatase family protein n=1 Tax=Actinoallomurus soli TaxID=2952535 RepID=UPI00209245F3|nr:metallophosphoesterase family protein [Actinoallomurus soli]MCO5968772.1 metallophosphoesterase family protein [Actinoallomurus soli]